MEGLVRLVAESLERHGFAVPPPRIDWSPWITIDPNLCLTAPCYPGLFVIAEQMVPHTVAANCAAQLVILKVGQTHDIGIEMARLCYHSPLYDRINTGRCLVRFAVVDNDSQRASAFTALLAHSFDNSTDSRFPPIWLPNPSPSAQEFRPNPLWPARPASQLQSIQRPCHPAFERPKMTGRRHENPFPQQPITQNRRKRHNVRS